MNAISRITIILGASMLAFVAGKMLESALDPSINNSGARE